MTSYHDDRSSKHHHQHQHHHPSMMDEFHTADMSTSRPWSDMRPRDPLAVSDEDYFPLSDDGGGGGGGGLCAACSVPIHDRHYLSAVGSNWHVSCLVCCECRQPLDRQTTCYVHDARVYCRDDYFALFVRRHCGRCRQPILYNELVVQTNDLVYHNECFTCVLCSHRFTPGQHFAVAEDGNVYCPLDFQFRHHGTNPGNVSTRDAVVSTRSGVPPVTGSDGRDQSVREPLCRSPLSSVDTAVSSVWSKMSWQQSETSMHSATARLTPTAGVGGAEMAAPSGNTDVVQRTGRRHDGHSRSRKRTVPAPSAAGDPSTVTVAPSAVNPAGGPGGAAGAGRPARPKRVRTTFKYHELRLMKTYFELNHNPDNNDLKQLSVKTGLTKRVLQVWFQNARAKHRRATLKRGLPDQFQPQPPPQQQHHQAEQHPHQLIQQQNLTTRAATDSNCSLIGLQPSSAAVMHQLTSSPTAGSTIPNFSLYESPMI